MISRYNSNCKRCGQPIVAGESKISKGRRSEGWIHEDCSSINGPIDFGQAPSSIPEVYNEFTPSQYQQDIFEFIQNGTGNAVVEAVAGSGKTTTIVKALSFTPPTDKVAFVAFNKHIADELKRRAPGHVKVCTLHSLGFSNLRRSLPYRQNVDENKLSQIMDGIPELQTRTLPGDPELLPEDRSARYTLRSSITKLVSLTKATLTDEWDAPAVMSMADRYGVDLNGEGDRAVQLLPEIIQLSAERNTVIDFDDMIWMPLRFELELEKFDWLFIDEAQDLNASQIKFVLNSIKPGGRIIAVGDRNQSLYGFRGADTQAIPRLIEALNATLLPLSITYRCPVSHVKLAQAFVPQIEARPDAIEGIVADIKEQALASLVRDGDMLVCRVNAPLISLAFQLIRAGVKATVRGRDIGKNMVTLVDKFTTDDISTFELLLSEYQRKEMERLERRKLSGQIMALTDKCDTLFAIAAECDSVCMIKECILAIFSDDIAGVVLSSVHRAKGLEADRVFILKPELMPHPLAKQEWEVEQEANCKYVAITRSKSELYFVRE